MTSRRFAAVGLALASSVLVGPSPTRGQYESFEEQTAVTLVEVPVTVIHRGQPVEGLTVDDFAVFDRGERQAIESFEVLEVDVARSAPGEPEAPEAAGTLAARRNFLFLFDLAYSDRRSLSGAASALDGLLAQGLAPGDRVGVGFFSALHGYQWLVGLTERHEEARHALEVMRAIIESDRDRARSLLGGWEPPAAVAPAGAAMDRDAILAEAGVSGGNRGAAGWPTTSILRALVRGLTRIADDTAGLDGRKYLVHLSYGLPDHVVTGRGSERARVLGLLQEIKHACRAAGWAIDSVNLAGLGFGRDSLLMMAKDTGGQLFTNSNDVGVLVREMEQTTRLTYLLTFQPTALEPDGAYHRIEVEVAGLPGGARVIHRPGYYAPSQE
jgi:VWFA-related protein